MTSNLLWLAPVVPLAVGSCMLLVRDHRLLSILDVGSSLAVLALVLGIARQVGERGPVSALGTFRADDVALVFLLLVGLLSVAVAIATVGWMRQELARGEMRPERLRYYYALVQGFVATMRSSGSRSRGCSFTIPTSSCSMKQPRRSTPKARTR